MTTLPCGEGGTGCDTLAAFRSAEARLDTGTMSVYFTCDKTTSPTASSALLEEASWSGVRLYICAQYSVENSTTPPRFTSRLKSITGMSFSVNPDDPTTGELSSVTKMISAFSQTA